MSLFQIKIIDAGLISYQQGLALQEKTWKQVYEGEIDGALILCEHTPVYTFGKSASKENLLISQEQLEAIGAEVFQSSRGGDITFHGPGQLVGYPILNLEKLGMGVRKYVESVEDVLIDTCESLGLLATRIDGLTGVWLLKNELDLDRKIGAIGIKISKGISMHGFAFNVHTDLKYFDYMVPCGILNKQVTSVSKELNSAISLPEISQIIQKKFEEIFNVSTF